MKVKCQKCKGLIKDCPDCKNFKDTFDRLHEEAKKSATYKAEMHFIAVHEIISQLKKTCRNYYKSQGFYNGAMFNINYYSKKVRVVINGIYPDHTNPYKIKISCHRIKENGERFRRHHGYVFHLKEFKELILN